MEDVEINESRDESFEFKDPQITSSDPFERKLARRLRIERRVEALRRQNMPEGEEAVEEIAERSLVQKQLDKSAEILEKLLIEAKELITNVRVANDSREVDRREEEGVGREKIIEALEEEANAATQMFNDIAEKWIDILKYNDPLQIHEDMELQKEKCQELIVQKDGIVAMLRREIKEAERKFTNDQRKQNEDITTLASRIEKQIKHMRKAYKQELKFIDDVILEERKIIVEANDKKWEELYKKRELEEKQQCEKKFEQQEDFIRDMDKIRVNHQEKFRETKILLEMEVEELQREFERVKTLAIMNSEKLDYNYQILKKREDENLILNSQQKRRINKLQDVANNLRKKNQAYDDHTKSEIERLTREVKKLQKCVVEIESKAVSMSKINDLKYKQVWDLNVANADKITGRISMIDKILHEQQMGLEWKKIDNQLLTKTQLSSYNRATELVKQDSKSSAGSKYSGKAKTSKMAANSSSKTFTESRKDIVPPKDPKSYDRLLRHIVEQIADRSGFLLEERLQELLEPYYDNEKHLVKVDNVFALRECPVSIKEKQHVKPGVKFQWLALQKVLKKALGIKDEENIDQMYQYFIPYAKCPICVKSTPTSARGSEKFSSAHAVGDDSSSGSSLTLSEETPLYSHIKTTVCQPDDVINDIVRELVESNEGSQSTITIDTETTEDECMPPVVKAEEREVFSVINASKKSLHTVRIGCKYNHPLHISSVFVIRALRKFLSVFFVDTSGVESLATRLSQKHTTISRLMSEEDVKLFWNKYKHFFNESRMRLWDGLFVGLQKYYEILKGFLKDRRKLNDEVLCLRKRNKELQLLLGKYNASKMTKPPCAEQREIPIRGQRLPKCTK